MREEPKVRVNALRVKLEFSDEDLKTKFSPIYHIKLEDKKVILRFDFNRKGSSEDGIRNFIFQALNLNLKEEEVFPLPPPGLP